MAFVGVSCDQRPEYRATAAKLGGTVRIETRGSVGSGAASSVIDAGRTNATAYPPSCVLCCMTGAVIATFWPAPADWTTGAVIATEVRDRFWPVM
jgi:hypothetical protein